MKIKDIEIIWLDVPFHDAPERNMARQQNGWHIVEICRVTTDNGLVGLGETLPNYTWAKVPKDAIERAKGASPAHIMWDDSLGAGLQMACFDVVGRAMGVPVYALLGRKHREWCPICWWGIDMSPEDYASESAAAVKAGYTSFKQKARPWWDVYEQMRLSCQEVGPNFKFDFDFNEHLINAATAVPVLKELDKCPNLAIYEEPIPRGDIMGNRRVREQTRCAIALHYAQPMLGIRDEICDGYVVCAGASRAMHAAHLCAEANMPFWLQLVGTGITTTWMSHLGAVCSHAQWPAVTCMNMYVDQLITKPIKVEGGYMKTPDGPGLGIEFNESALKWKVNSPDKAQADAIYAIVRPTGQKLWYATEFGPHGFWTENWAGNVPLFDRGVRLETWANDGSKDWKDLRERLKSGPVWAS